MALLGTTVDTGRVHDVLSVVHKIRKTDNEAKARAIQVTLAGYGHAAVLAAAAAAIEPQVDEVVLIEPPESFMEPQAPQFLNVLRVIDVPEFCGWWLHVLSLS